MSVSVFQWGSIILWFVMIALILKFEKNGHHMLWTLLAITLTFPIEALYDKCFALTYSDEFINLFPTVPLPLMIPFAYGTFYGITLLLAIWVFKKLPNVPNWLAFILMFVSMVFINFAQEGLTTSTNAWVYDWPNAPGLFGSNQPWIVPVTVAANLPLFFFSHRFATKMSSQLGTKKEQFFMHFGIIQFATLIIFAIGNCILLIYGGPQ